ncbi:MAG: DUF4349 domain-containing protein [Clostridia bacterium]|nr:DUF4349 domain-containing protein [Clostridia bacterium]
MNREDIYDAVTEIDDEIIEQAKNANQKKSKLPKYLKQITAAAAAVLVLFVAGKAFAPYFLEKSSPSNIGIQGAISNEINMTESQDLSDTSKGNGIFGMQESADSKLDGNSEAVSGEQTGGASGADNGSIGESGQYGGQKLVKTISLTLETKEFDKCMQNINQKTTELGGYVENSKLSGRAEKHSRYASVTLRIPSDRIEEMRGTLADFATITYSTESTKDVTLEYVDAESRLKALRTELDTLLNLLESATKLSDIMSIQSQITSVRYQIESYESRLRTMQNKVSYGTISISVEEVYKETNTNPSFFDEIKDKFEKSAENIYEAAKGFIIWFIGSLPYFVIIAAVAVIVVVVVKKIKKNRK